LPWEDPGASELAAVTSVQGGRPRRLAPLRMVNKPNFVVRFPEATVCPGNLAVR